MFKVKVWLFDLQNPLKNSFLLEMAICHNYSSLTWLLTIFKVMLNLKVWLSISHYLYGFFELGCFYLNFQSNTLAIFSSMICSSFWRVDYFPQTHLKGREPKDHSRELVLDEHEVIFLSIYQPTSSIGTSEV